MQYTILKGRRLIREGDQYMGNKKECASYTPDDWAPAFAEGKKEYTTDFRTFIFRRPQKKVVVTKPTPNKRKPKQVGKKVKRTASAVR